MAGESKKDNTPGYLNELFLANPTVVVTLLYFYVTAIGMLYSAVLRRNFGITIFDYSQIGDFLLAAFKNPIAFLSGGLFAAMGAAIVAWMSRILRSWDNTAFRVLPVHTEEERAS